MTDKPWLAHYDPGVPHSLQPYPNKSLSDLLREIAQERPNHPALLFKGATLTYGDFDRLSDNFASALISLGVRAGDRVALLLPNCPQFLIAQVGAWRTGAIVSPLNPLYTAEELEHTLLEIGATSAVVLTPYYRKLKTIQSALPLNQIIATNIKEFLPGITRMLFTLFQERREGHRIRIDEGDLWFCDLLERHRDAPPPQVVVAPNDPALLIFTGGTTGRPKAALSTHQGLLISGMQIHSWITNHHDDWDSVSLLLMPLFHTYGNVGAFGASLVGRHKMVLVPNPRDLDDVVRTIDRARPVYLSGVPTLFIALLRHPDIQSGRAKLTSIRLCLCGASALLQETKERFEAATGGRIVEGYALTESVMAAAITPVKGVYKPGAVGLPLPDVEIRIVEPSDGQEILPLGEIGEVTLRAPQMMRGYWRRAEETAAMLRDGWLYTGDLGYLDNEGYLYLVDRKKDVIKPSGFQVWPREVEEVIAMHPAVDEVGVAGIPDPYQVEAVKAWIVVRQGSQVDEDELHHHCREHLVAYKVPRHYAFCSQLPKSSVGKVLRRELVNLP